MKFRENNFILLSYYVLGDRMTIQIEIVSSNNPRRLKQHIERFLLEKSITKKEFIDIKLNANGEDLTALIIYEK